MHVQVVNFHLKDMTDGEYAKLCDDFAPTIAAIPGLISKTWLADPASNTYGGVYTWRDRTAMEAYASSDLFRSVLSHPNLADINSTDFSVMYGPTAVTHGMAAIPA